MGVIIEKHRVGLGCAGHAHVADDFTTDATGRLAPVPGEVFETMPAGCLEVIAFTNVANAYRQSPYTMEGMSWETSFSQMRVSFYSPQTSTLLGGVNTRQGQATLGFYYYTELRSLSLGSRREPGGPYVSAIFLIQATASVQLPIGVRVHGSPEHLNAYVTLLGARTAESYAQLSALLGLDITALAAFFEDVHRFDFSGGLQTDFFINALGDTIVVDKDMPLARG